MTYSEYLGHLQKGDCPKLKVFECPTKCDTDENRIKKYSYQELRRHLRYYCPNI